MLNRMDRDDAIAELRRVKRLRERADAAQKAATEATEPAVVAALRAGLRPVEIVKECGVSDSYVRGVRRANEIPANPSYANLKPPTRTKAAPAKRVAPSASEPEPWAEPSPLMRPLAQISEAELPARIREMRLPDQQAIVAQIRRAYPTWHDETRAEVAAAPPLFHDGLEIKRAKDAGILDDLGVELP